MQFFHHYWQQTFESLQVRNYRLYFYSQAISLSGNWVQIIAQAWLVLQLTGSGAALGVVVGLQFLPSLLLGPWAGSIIDSVPKRRILYVTHVAAAVLALTLGIVVATDIVQLWMIYGLSLGIGLVNAFDLPTRQLFSVSLVDKHRLQNAVTLGALEANVARIIGPAVGAACIAIFSLAGCFFVNAASFIVGIVGLLMMREKEFFIHEHFHPIKGGLRAGIRYIRHNEVPRIILLMMILIGALACELFVTLPLLAKDSFAGSVNTYAGLTIALSVGAIVGGLYVARCNVPRRIESLAWLALLFGMSLLLLAMAPTYQMALGALVLVGGSQIALTTRGFAMMLSHTKPEMRGRMTTWWTMIFLGSTPIGGPLVGWIAQQTSAGWALAVGGFATILVAIAVFALHPVQRTVVEAQPEN